MRVFVEWRNGHEAEESHQSPHHGGFTDVEISPEERMIELHKGLDNVREADGQ